MILPVLFVLAAAIVDPATYVGNVYGSVEPARAGVVVSVVDDGVTIRTATTDAEGRFLINNVPAPYDGREYDVVAGDAALRKVRVLPGATMALEATLRSGGASTWHYRHERLLDLPKDGRSGAAAFTFNATVFATREGLVGGTTANGHVIVTNDRFVALPSRRALSSNFGHEREVRLTYAGRVVVAPVWDVGPWNTRDDYWSPPNIRERFSDLPMRKPESQAAFLEGYNGGKDERGRAVLNPAGIDLADGTFRLDLALPDNDYVNVEYLFVDNDGPAVASLTALRSDPNTITVDAVVDDRGSGNAPITAAEYFIDNPGSPGTGTPLSAADGAFDSPAEGVRVTLPASGTHTIYVRGRDIYGNWGPLSNAIATSEPLPKRRAARH